MPLTELVALLAALLLAAPTWAADRREYSAFNEVKLENGKTFELTQYANNDASRLCFTYAIPLKWSLMKGEPGTLVHELGLARVSVLSWSPQELAEFTGEDLVHRAAARLRKVYDQAYAARSQVAPASELAPYMHDRFRALEIKRAAFLEPSFRQDDRFLVAEIGSNWVLGITVEYILQPPTSCSFCGELFSTVVRSILETVATTTDPTCYTALQPIPWEMVSKVRSAVQRR